MRIEPEISGASIVLVGSFNPKIFSPDWFARHELLAGDEAEAANVEVIHEEITLFRTDWFSLRVERTRFVTETKQSPYIRLSDFVVRTFQEFLSHTPIGRLGINRQVHFDVGSFEDRDRIGNLLAPKEPWGEWVAQLAAGEGREHGGMTSLTMEQRLVDDRPKGRIRARIEPSAKIKDGISGIFVEINDHFEVDNADLVVGCEEIINILETRFDASIERSEWIIDQVMGLK